MRTERAPSPSYSRDKGTDEQGPRIRRWQEEGRDRRLSAPGLQQARRLRSKRFSTRGETGGKGRGRGGQAKGTVEGRTVVEGDRKGRVVVIGSKEDTYWTLSGVFITPFSRARRFKCFWLCLRTRVHPPSPSFPLVAPLFSPLSHYTPLTGYASSHHSRHTPFPLPQDFYGLDLLARRFVNHAKCTALKGATTT